MVLEGLITGIFGKAGEWPTSDLGKKLKSFPIMMKP
jgi:hypothetical protein